MTIEIDYYIWNKEKTEILQMQTLKLDEERIFDMLRQEYEEGSLPKRMNIIQEETVVEFSISKVTV